MRQYVAEYPELAAETDIARRLNEVRDALDEVRGNFDPNGKFRCGSTGAPHWFELTDTADLDAQLERARYWARHFAQTVQILKARAKAA